MDKAKEEWINDVTKFLAKGSFCELTSDVVFKALFTRMESDAPLKSLLETFLPLPEGSAVSKVAIKNPELVSKNQSGEPKKTYILDVKVEFERTLGDGTSSTESCNVELQAYNHECVLERILSYDARMYSDQAPKGGLWKNQTPVYSVVFFKHNLARFKGTPDMGHLFTVNKDGGWIIEADGAVTETKTEADAPGKRIEKGIYVSLVELGKLPKNPLRWVDFRVGWCYLLLNSSEIKADEFKEIVRRGGEPMAEAFKGLFEISQDEHLREVAEAREKEVRGILSAVAEGEAKGEAKGKAEGKEDVALKMLAKELDTALISEMTGIPESKLEMLKKRVSKK